MAQQNRTSVAQSIQNSLDYDPRSIDSEASNPVPSSSNNELKPTMHKMLKQFIRESKNTGSVRSTFKNFTKLQEREENKQIGIRNQNEFLKKEDSKIAVSLIQAVSITKMGIRNYDNMQNQDVLMQDSLCQNCRLYGVFDGHGQYGREIALTAKNIFQSLLRKYHEQLKMQSNSVSVDTVIKKVLQKTNAYLLHYKASQSEFSGTTVLIVVVTNTTIYVFNIGNSRLVLGKEYESTGTIEPFQITHDQTLDRFDERLRITKTQAQIAPYKNQKGEFIGPERIWAHNEKYPGIIITRTLGLSCSYKLGVISEPQVSIIEYKNNFKFLVLASDGLWRVQSNSEVVSLLAKYYPNTLMASANTLMFQALKRWRDSKQLMDDVSLIVIPLIKE